MQKHANLFIDPKKKRKYYMVERKHTLKETQNKNEDREKCAAALKTAEFF
jgi:hypothetical protein